MSIGTRNRSHRAYGSASGRPCWWCAGASSVENSSRQHHVVHGRPRHGHARHLDPLTGAQTVCRWHGFSAGREHDRDRRVWNGGPCHPACTLRSMVPVNTRVGTCSRGSRADLETRLPQQGSPPRPTGKRPNRVAAQCLRDGILLCGLRWSSLRPPQTRQVPEVWPQKGQRPPCQRPPPCLHLGQTRPLGDGSVTD